MKKLVLIILLLCLKQIHAQCPVNISGKASFCQGTSDTLTASGASSYTWMPSGVTSPTLIINSAGIYTVTATTGTCIATNTVAVTLYPVPSVSTMLNDSGCANAIVSVPAFTVTPANSTISWMNSNNNIGLVSSGTGNIPSFTGNNFNSSLNIAGISAVASANGCVGTSTSFTIVIKPIPIAQVTSATVCPSNQISISINIDPANASIAWTNNNTAIGLPATGIGAPPLYNAPANITLAKLEGIISYTPSLNGCFGPVAKDTIVIKPEPFMQHNLDQYVCPGQFSAPVNFSILPLTTGPDVVYNWSYTAIGVVGGSGNPFPAIGPIPNAGQTTLKYTVTVYPTLNGCVGPDSSFSIYVYPGPLANFDYSKHTCLGQLTSFIDLSTSSSNIPIAQWNWNFDNGQGTSTLQNPNYVFGTAGTQTVSLTVTTNPSPLPQSGGCKDTFLNYPYVNPIPLAAFNGDSLKSCPSLYTAFQSFPVLTTPFCTVTSYTWNFGNGQASNLETPPRQVYTNLSDNQSAFYSVSLMVATDSGCISPKNTKNNYIEVYPRPGVSVTLQKDSVVADTWDAYVIYSTNTSSATWNWGDGTSTVGFYPSHVYATTGTYSICVVVQNSYGCADSTCLNDSISVSGNMVYVNIKANPAGISQSSVNNEQLSIYPNPSNGVFAIKNSSLNSGIAVLIYDVNGKPVLSQVINNSKVIIDASNLNEGIYNVSILSNGEMINKRLIIVK
jgi:PKD repeat protein